MFNEKTNRKSIKRRNIENSKLFLFDRLESYSDVNYLH